MGRKVSVSAGRARAVNARTVQGTAPHFERSEIGSTSRWSPSAICDGRRAEKAWGRVWVVVVAAGKRVPIDDAVLAGIDDREVVAGLDIDEDALARGVVGDVAGLAADVDITTRGSGGGVDDADLRRRGSGAGAALC